MPSASGFRAFGGGTPFRYRASGQIVVFHSAGDDHAFATADDLVVTDTVRDIRP